MIISCLSCSSHSKLLVHTYLQERVRQVNAKGRIKERELIIGLQRLLIFCNGEGVLHKSSWHRFHVILHYAVIPSSLVPAYSIFKYKITFRGPQIHSLHQFCSTSYMRYENIMHYEKWLKGTCEFSNTYSGSINTAILYMASN